MGKPDKGTKEITSVLIAEKYSKTDNFSPAGLLRTLTVVTELFSSSPQHTIIREAVE